MPVRPDVATSCNVPVFEEVPVLAVLVEMMRRQHHGEQRHLGVELDAHQPVDRRARDEIGVKGVTHIADDVTVQASLNDGNVPTRRQRKWGVSYVILQQRKNSGKT